MKAAATAPSFRPRWIRATEAQVEGQVVTITAGMYGRVERIGAVEGELVTKGQLLVELDHRQLDRNIEVAAAALAQAEDDAGIGRGVRTAAEPVPLAALRRVQGRYTIARMQRARAELYAPVAGRVLGIRVRPGDHVTLAQPLVSIVDSADLWVLAKFDRADHARLYIGQPATVSAGGRLFPARISGLVGADEPALLDLDERPGATLRPGTLASASVAAG
jgi:multidrug resistance efflux pump